MTVRIVVLAALLAILAIPFALRKRAPSPGRADDTVVIVTPHNEAIRHEFGTAFQRWYRERTGRTVAVDWRVVGGTSEIVKFLKSEYTTAFENLWRRQLKREWSNDVLAGAMNGQVATDDSPADDTPAEAARRAFLASGVGCGIDVFFGGGTADFEDEAKAGRLIDSGLLAKRPEWFTEDVIPETFSGESYRDREGRWFGCVVSSYGLLYSNDSLKRLGVPAPGRWSDLTDPRLQGEVALADPTKSSSIAKAFEMVIQQEIQRRLAALRGTVADPAEREARAIREGWIEGLRILQLAGANARYFTDTSQKPPIDVSQGNAAVGMCIDFYGRYQAEAVRRRDGGERLHYVTPAGGSVVSVDPLGMLRGAPNRSAGAAFMEFVLSMEGQKLWNLQLGAPGGPERFALRRLPVRKDFYAENAWLPLRSDPEVNPFADADPLIYHREWTGPLFKEMSLIIRAMCLDTHLELRAAWADVAAAGRPAAAMRVLNDLSSVSYDRAGGEIKRRLASKNKADELALAQELAQAFRDNYESAAKIARESRKR